MNISVFTIEIAGIPEEIRCRFPSNRSFFTGYFTEKAPAVKIEASDADLENIRVLLDRMSNADDLPKTLYTEDYIENNAIHSILAEKLVPHGVLLMHGSALCMDGQAIIFTAPSGTGKSTHARLWKEVFGNRVWMINDDKPLIRIEDGKATVYGTPWDGKHHLSRNASAPLRAIVRLERDETNHIEPMKKADAFSILMKHAYISNDPVTMMKILDLDKQLLDAADFFELGCNMTPEAAMTAWGGIKNNIRSKK